MKVRDGETVKLLILDLVFLIASIVLLSKT